MERLILEGKESKDKPFSTGIKKILEILEFEKQQSDYEKALDNLKLYDSISHHYDTGKLNRIYFILRSEYNCRNDGYNTI